MAAAAGGGNYFLANDIEVDGTDIPDDKNAVLEIKNDFRLCLNGYTCSIKTASQKDGCCAMSVDNLADFIVGECSSGKTGKISLDVDMSVAQVGQYLVQDLPETVPENMFTLSNPGDFVLRRVDNDKNLMLDKIIEINETNFPDEKFRDFVTQNYDADMDGKLYESDIIQISSMNAGGKEISNLKGIEYFTGLTSLDCSENSLAALDLSQNKKLTELNAGKNTVLIRADSEYDLNTLPGMDITKIKDIQGAELSEGGKLTNFASDGVITIVYDVGNENVTEPSFTLKISKTSETDKPDSTNPPTVTDKPENTTPPTVTDKPENTTPPTVTDKPENTNPPTETDKPENTNPPTKTDKPENTNPPTGTDKPNSTNPPTGTDKPENTNPPSETDKPGQTVEPVVPGAGTVTAEAVKKNVLSLNAKLKVSQTGKNINIAWGKVAGADGYDVYVQYCGMKFTAQSITEIKNGNKTSVTVKKVNGKPLNLKKNYKIYIAAYKNENGKKITLGKTIIAHIVGKNNNKYTNVKAVKVKKSSYRLKKAKKVKIKATTVLVSSGKKQLTNAHAKQFRYATTNKEVATVSSKGVITAAGKGKCTIYVYARNGYAKTIKVTVS